MNSTSKTAIGAMITAISVIVLIPTALESFVYALPAMAGMLIMLSIVELGKNWAFTIYLSVSIISLILVPNKEACILYVAFFGYYPILKSIFESKFKKIIEYLLKFLVFNVSIVLAYIVLTNVMGVPFDEMMGLGEDDGFLAKYGAAIFLALGNAVFIVFDIALTRVVTAYIVVWQKKLRKMFKFK